MFGSTYGPCKILKKRACPILVIQKKFLSTIETGELQKLKNHFKIIKITYKCCPKSQQFTEDP
jgi:hypothetical protein